jgi:hypothetical protein
MTKEQIDRLTEKDWSVIEQYQKDNQTFSIKMGTECLTASKRKNLEVECKKFLDYLKEKKVDFETYSEEELTSIFNKLILTIKKLRLDKEFNREQKQEALNFYCEKLKLFFATNEVDFIINKYAKPNNTFNTSSYIDIIIKYDKK